MKEGSNDSEKVSRAEFWNFEERLNQAKAKDGLRFLQARKRVLRGLIGENIEAEKDEMEKKRKISELEKALKSERTVDDLYEMANEMNVLGKEGFDYDLETLNEYYNLLQRP